jgi:hypothetical protein
VEPPANAIRDRDYRINLEPESVTAMLMGDPPKGYSALDRKERIAMLPPRPKISAVVRP